MSANNPIPVINKVEFSYPSLWKMIGYAFASFLLVQILGLFGFFIALAYPLWWFFLPGKTICFFCLHTRITSSTKHCPVCRREVMTVYDPPFYSVFINMLVIFFIAFISSTVVFVELSFITNKNILLTNQNHISMYIPTKNSYNLNENFYIDLELDNLTQPINVVHADLVFDTEKLQIQHISTEQSFATIFVQKDYSNKDGWIRIVGGLANPGFIGQKGHFARIYFQPIRAGVSQLEFLASSELLANDGKGTKVPYRFIPSSILIQDK